MTERYRLALLRESAPEPMGIQILGPENLASVARPIVAAEAQEVVLCLHLDRRHRVRGYSEVSRGGITSAPVDLRVLFGSILLAGCPAFAIAHNHPSGDVTPSPEDVALTRRIAKAADLLGIEFIDHLVVGTDAHTSLRERGAFSLI